jgi:hypothetical protein
MAGPIYKSWRVKVTEAWHQLSKSEQDALMAKVTAALDAVDGKVVVMCAADWANERWTAFGVEEFPDLEAVQKHTALLNELNWFRYIDSEHLLGTPWE